MVVDQRRRAVSTFPESIVDALKAHLGPDDDGVPQVEGITAAFARQLRRSDVNGGLGIHVDDWVAIDYEMGGTGLLRPTVKEYNLTLAHMVKNLAEEPGAKTHREVAKSLLAMLVEQSPLTVALRQLVGIGDTYTERIDKWQVPGQKFADNEIEGSFVYLSATELTITVSS